MSRSLVIVVASLTVAAVLIAQAPVADLQQREEAVVALGRRLFYDPVLSVDNSTSCGTCHQQFAAFAHVDHALSHGVHGRIGTRNVPALQNMAHHPALMWDGAIEELDMQAASPLTNPEEMGETLSHLVQKLDSVGWCAPMMERAYGTAEITVPRILRALGRFVASLQSRNARFDRWQAGHDTLSENERRGYELFQEHCASCHAGVDLTNYSYRSNGLSVDTSLNDIGRERVTLDVQDRYRFKVPSLRNIERTAPYMHDGRFKRLRDVLAFYGNPSARAAHADPLAKKIPALDDRQRKDLLAFLLTLTDVAFLRDTAYAERETW